MQGGGRGEGGARSRETNPNAGAGLGLFASAPVPAGATCCCLYGEIHSVESYREEVLDTAYGILLPRAAARAGALLPRQSRDLVLDCAAGAGLAGVKARYANDPRSAEATNCRFEPEPQFLRARLVAVRDLRVGEELYVDYGEAYWLRHEGRPNTLRVG